MGRTMEVAFLTKYVSVNFVSTSFLNEGLLFIDN